MFLRTAQCRRSAVRSLPHHRPSSSSASSQAAQRADILQCTRCSLFAFGDPTSEPSRALFRDLTWRIRDVGGGDERNAEKSEAWALVGPRANLLVDASLLGRARADPPDSRKWPILSSNEHSQPIQEAIKKVSFNTRLESNSYLSQTGEFTDYTARYYGIRKDDEDAVTLREHLGKYAKSKDMAKEEEEEKEKIKVIEDTASMLKLDHLLDVPLIALSNGQTRRARIARALLTKPEVLVLEEPFTGLDVASRKSIADLLGKLHEARSPRIVLVLRPQDTVPSWIDHIIGMGSPTLQQPSFIGSAEEWRLSTAKAPSTARPPKATLKRACDTDPEIFSLTEANVKYNDRHILKDITWQLKAGDRAVLTGANGSGKSTLLSLILGDHPASYTQELSLFGQPRSKHSVYSLSQRIGHYSPELFASFPRRHGDAGLSLFEVIGTGFENIFTYRKLSEEQKNQIETLIKKFDPEERFLTHDTLHRTLFVEAEPSLQALSLILRAAIKQPDLLVLDEPFAGMNPELVQQCRKYLDNELEDRQTLIFISHYEEEWPSSIGRRMHLEAGVGKVKDI